MVRPVVPYWIGKDRVALSDGRVVTEDEWRKNYRAQYTISKPERIWVVLIGVGLCATVIAVMACLLPS